MKLLTTLALVLLCAPTAAAVLTVGPPGSGAQFTDIQDAVDAAAPNDVILVQPGTYGPVTVTKPVRIEGDGTGDVIVAVAVGVALVVESIGPGEEVVISSVEVQANPLSFNPFPASILVRNNQGTVVLRGIRVDHPSSEIGVEIIRSDRVLLLFSEILEAGTRNGATVGGAVVAVLSEVWIAGCEITGGSLLTPFNEPGRPGVQVASSALHVWRSTVRGGDALGGLPDPFAAAAGGSGVDAQDSTVVLYGGPPGDHVRGGQGAVSYFGANGAGGPGVDLRNSSARIQQDVSIGGGFDGLGTTQAPAVQLDATSTSTTETRIFPTLIAFPHAVVGGGVLLGADGTPFGTQTVFASLDTGPTTTLPGVEAMGVLNPVSVVALTTYTLSFTGNQNLVFLVPPDPAFLGATLFFQAVEASGGELAFSNPALVTVTL